VTALAFSADGRSLAGAGDDGVLRVWASPTTSTGGATSIAGDGRVVVQRLAGHRLSATASGVTRRLDRVASLGIPSFDRNGVHAATAVGSALELWDLTTGSVPQVLPAGRFVLAAAVSPDGRWVASAERDRLRLFRWPARNPVVVAQVPDAAAEQVFYEAAAFNSEDARMAAGGYLGKTASDGLASQPGGRRVVLHSLVPSAVTKLSLSPDGRSLAALRRNGLGVT
jgi:WD40 repeat protein